MKTASEYLADGAKAFQEGNLDDAISKLRQALQLSPNDPNTLEYLGIAYSRKGETTQAILALRKAVQLAPNVARTHFNLGRLYEKINNPDHARPEYAAALKADPTYAKAREALDALTGNSKQAAWTHKSYIRCAFHPDRPYKEYCTSCHRPLCEDCIIMEAGEPYCPLCTSRSKAEIPVVKQDNAPLQSSIQSPMVAPPIEIPQEIAAQQLQEMPPEAATLPKVGLMPRIGALWMDAFIISLIGCIVNGLFAPIIGIGYFSVIKSIISGSAGMPAIASMLASNAKGPIFTAAFLPVLINIIFVGIYFIFFVGKYGQTPGKMLIHAVIIKSNGDAVGYPQAVLRWIVMELFHLPYAIGSALLTARGMPIILGFVGKYAATLKQQEDMSTYGVTGIPGVTSAPSMGGTDWSPLILPILLISLTALLWMINGMILAMHPDHRAIHDMAAGTMVVQD